MMKVRFSSAAALLLLIGFIVCATPNLVQAQEDNESVSVQQVMSDEYVLAELTERVNPPKRAKSVSLKPTSSASTSTAVKPSTSASKSTVTKVVRPNPLGNVADRLTEKQMRDKYNRFLARNKRRAAKLKTSSDQQVSYAEFKKNRERIVNLNQKHGRVVYKSDGPFADMPKDKFQKRRLNTKNPRRRKRKDKKKIANDWFTNKAAIRARIKNGYPKTTARAQVKGSSSAVKTSSPASHPMATKSRKPSKSSKGALVEMDSAQFSRSTSAANPTAVNIYTKITTYDQANGGAANGGGAAGSAGMAPKRIAGIGSAGKSGKTGGADAGAAGKSGKTGGADADSAAKSGKTGGADADSAAKSGKTGGDGSLPNGVQVGSAAVSASTVTVSDILNHLLFSGVDADTANSLITDLSPMGARSGAGFGDEQFTSYDTQGDCGSCWAHSASRAISILRTRSSAMGSSDAALWQPSVQQLLECVHTDDTHGCDGGTPMDALDWMESHVIGKMDNLEPATNDDKYYGVPPPYPMADTVGDCKLNVSNNDPSYSNGLRSAGWQMSVPECTQEPCHNQAAQEMAMYDRVRSSNRIIVYGYSGGIFPITDCSPTMNAGNHVVELIGIGSDPQTKVPTWIARNSWSAAWGEGGYIRLPFGVNACGLANFGIEAVDWSHSYSDQNTVPDKPKEFQFPIRGGFGASGTAGVELIEATKAKYRS